MTTDLSGLEHTAASLGLAGLHARLVPAERRRGRWFRWLQGELLVSERVVERLRPEEGQALLVHAIIDGRHRRRVLERWLGVVVLAVLGVWGLASAWPGALWPIVVVAIVIEVVALALLRGLGSVAADDETVRELGDAELLVRAVNTIQQDELLLGPWRRKARPDLHRRMERLVTLHQLRLPPELRTVPTVGGCSGRCGESADEDDPARG